MIEEGRERKEVNRGIGVYTCLRVYTSGLSATTLSLSVTTLSAVLPAAL
jgi:hypothetical protein